MSLFPPPNSQNIVNSNKDLTAPLQWISFFNQTYTGDAGQSWLPTFTSLTTTVGSPTITGYYTQLSKYVCLFNIVVTPASGGTTSATAGTTYASNFPLTMNGDGVCWAVANNLGTSAGMCTQINSRVYVPTWTTVSNPVTVIGLVLAS